MLRQFVVGMCVIVSAPVWAQSKSGLDDIGERLQWELRENSRATRRAMEAEVNSFVSRPYVGSDDAARYRERETLRRLDEIERELRYQEWMRTNRAITGR